MSTVIFCALIITGDINYLVQNVKMRFFISYKKCILMYVFMYILMYVFMYLCSYVSMSIFG